METQKLQFDLFDDRYQVIERVSAKARNIRIEVRSRREVVLVIPRRASRQAAREFLAAREDWIKQKLAELQLRGGDAALDPQRMNWDNRDRIPLRGVDTPVRLSAASLRGISLRLEAGGIDVFCPSALLGDRRKLEQALRQGLQHQARQDALRLLAEESTRLGLRYGELRIADQKSLWGSCAANGNISLSWRLVMAPPAVFRYVVVHELCHVRHHDHSDAFWALVARQMPDYDQHRSWLRDHGPRLHLHLPPRSRIQGP
ncbi:MAG: M48 family metallopeptidase [Stenotrophobium sp.]